MSKLLLYHPDGKNTTDAGVRDKAINLMVCVKKMHAICSAGDISNKANHDDDETVPHLFVKSSKLEEEVMPPGSVEMREQL